MEEPTPSQPQQLTRDESLAIMRKSYKLAAVSHFVGLYSHHLDFQHLVEELENDLTPSRSGNEQYLPYMLGKLLNTLSNDRNTNHTNWLNALRRSYNRRVTLRSDNPFYSWIKVPASVVEAERQAEREREQLEWEKKHGGASGEGGDNVKGEDGEGEERKGIFDDEDRNLREAEKRKKSNHNKNNNNNVVGKSEEAGAADIDMSGRQVETSVPVTNEAVDDGFNAELADVIAEDAAKGEAVDKLEEEKENGVEKKEDQEEEEEEWWEEQRAVEWKDLSLETKIDAIYNVCEWHMVDPDRQFRKYLQFDGESAWRLDPTGSDSSNNLYYHLSDDRLWVQHPIPSALEASQLGCPPPPDPIVKPKTLLGLRAGPRDKSKKGTITGVVRFKLKRDAKTGDFRQVRDDEDLQDVQVGTEVVEKRSTRFGAGGSGRASSETSKPRSYKKKKNDDDEDFELGGDEDAKQQARKEREAERDEEELLNDDDDPFADLEDEEEQRRHEEEQERKKKELLAQKEKEEEEAREMSEWEKEFWAERWRAENTPGFSEWEAICTTVGEYKALVEKFEDSEDAEEQDLRDYILEWLPGYEETIKEREKTREEELQALQRRVSTRTGRDSTMDTVARLAAEEAALGEKYTRVTRGKVAMNEDGGESSSAPTKQAQGESREERLRKREEEKRAREEAEERRALEEAREQERAEAMERNGGVLPYEFMNEDERAAFDRQQEKEKKKQQKDAEKKKRDEKQRARARERRAELKAEKEAQEAELAEFEAEINPHEDEHDDLYAGHYQQQAHAVPMVAAPVNEEPPWFTDCEVCGRQGWNIDDGVETICCEQCEEWQHLPCHIQRDAQQGRPPVNYSDESYQFYCIRCQANPNRRGRPIPPAHELPPPPTPILPPPAPVQPPPTQGTKRKASGSSGKAAKVPVQKKAKPTKQQQQQQQQQPMNGGAAAYGHGHHPLYHPSAYSHVQQSASPTLSAHHTSPPPPPPQQQQAPPPQQQQPQAAPAAQQPQMTYDELSARVQQDPRLLSQLPPAYQAHFAEKFGISLT